MKWRIVRHKPVQYWQDRLKERDIKWQWYYYIIPRPYEGGKVKGKAYKWLVWIIYEEI